MSTINSNYSNRPERANNSRKRTYEYNNRPQVKRSAHFANKNVSNMTDNARLNQELMQMKTPRELLDTWNVRRHEFNEVNFATLISQFTKKRPNAQEELELQAVTGEVGQFLRAMGPITLANMANALSKCSFTQEQVFRKIEVEIVTRYDKAGLSKFGMKHISLLVNSFGQKATGCSHFFSTVTKVISSLDSREKFDEMNLSQIATGFAHTENVPDEIVRFFEGKITDQELPNLSSRTLASLVQCLSKKASLSRNLLTKIQHEIFMRYEKNGLKSFNFLDISIIIYSLGDRMSRELTEAFHNALDRRFQQNQLADFNVLALANTALGFSKVNLETEKRAVFSLIEKALLTSRRRQEFVKGDPKAITSLVNSFAKVDFKSFELFTKLKEAILEKGLSEFQIFSIALIASAFAKFEFYDETLFRSIHDEFLNRAHEKRLGTISLADLANISNGFRKIEFDCRDLFFALEDSIFEKMEALDFADFELYDVSLLANAFSLKELGSKKLFSLFEKKIMDEYEKNRLNACSAQSLALIVSGFARAGFGSLELFSNLEEAVKHLDFSSLQPLHLSLLNFGFSQKVVGKDVLFSQFENEILRRYQLNQLAEFDSRTLANCAHSFTKVNFGSGKLFDALEASILRRFSEKGFSDFSAYSLTLIVCAFSKQGHKYQRLIKTCEDAVFFYHTKNELADFSSRYISELAQSFVKAEVYSVDLFSAFFKRLDKLWAEHKLFENPRPFVNMLSAFVTSGNYDLTVHELFKRDLRFQFNKNRFRDFEIIDFSILLNNLSATRFLNKALVLPIEEVLVERFEKRRAGIIAPQDVSLIVNAFASGRDRCWGGKKFYSCVENYLLDEFEKNRFSEFSLQSIVNILHGFASAGFGKDALFEALESALLREYQKNEFLDFNVQGLCNSLWALTVKRRYETKAFMKLCEVLEKRANEGKLEHTKRHLSQLTHVELFLRLKKAENLRFKGKLSESIRSFDYKKVVGKELRPSRKQADFFKHLCMFKPELTNEDNYEQWIADCISVDILIEKEKLVIEFHGPYHYQFDTKDLIGPSLFKQQLLCLLGYKVLTIPYTKWQDLDTEEKLDLIKQIFSQL